MVARQVGEAMGTGTNANAAELERRQTDYLELYRSLQLYLE